MVLAPDALTAGLTCGLVEVRRDAPSVVVVSNTADEPDAPVLVLTPTGLTPSALLPGERIEIDTSRLYGPYAAAALEFTIRAALRTIGGPQER